jgi:hypothetical protein
LLDPEPVREWRIDLERLLRLLDLLLLAEVLDRPHVVKAVRKLDEDDAEVRRHRDDHLAVVLRLRLFARLELDPRQLRDALDKVGDLFAELLTHLLDRRLGVLDDVVEERRGNGFLVELQAREDERHAVWVMDEVLARAPLLPLVGPRGEQEGASQQVAVDVRVVRRDLCEQLIDEALIPLVKLDDSHGLSVLPGPFGSFSVPAPRI